MITAGRGTGVVRRSATLTVLDSAMGSRASALFGAGDALSLGSGAGWRTGEACFDAGADAENFIGSRQNVYLGAWGEGGTLGLGSGAGSSCCQLD
jgi:hypothetical protein